MRINGNTHVTNTKYPTNWNIRLKAVSQIFTYFKIKQWIHINQNWAEQKIPIKQTATNISRWCFVPVTGFLGEAEKDWDEKWRWRRDWWLTAEVVAAAAPKTVDLRHIDRYKDRISTIFSISAQLSGFFLYSEGRRYSAKKRNCSFSIMCFYNNR